MKTLVESIFDGDLVSKDLSPFIIAQLYKDYQYNTTDGGKDCFGRPLKSGDLVFVCDDHCIGVYVSKKGQFCEVWLSYPKLEANENDSLRYFQRHNCGRIIKLNEKDIK